MDELEQYVAQKPGLKTTEFWTHLIVSTLSLLVGFNVIPVGLDQKYSALVQAFSFLAAAASTGLYALGRGKAKSGPSTANQLLGVGLTQLSALNPAAAEAYIGQLLPELHQFVPQIPDHVSGKLLKTLESMAQRVEQAGPSVVSALEERFQGLEDALRNRNEGSLPPVPAAAPAPTWQAPPAAAPVAEPVAPDAVSTTGAP